MMRATFFFSNQAGYGWTETWHNNLTTNLGVLNNAISLIDLRCAMMGSDADMNYIRVSDDDVFRDSQVYTVPPEVGLGTYGGQAASANVCLNVRSIPNPATTSQVRKNTYLRGLPKAILTGGDKYNPVSQWNAAFNAWSKAMTTGNWAIKTIDRLILPHAITNVAQVLPSGLTTITTADAHSLVPGFGVNISGVAGASQVNGRWLIQSVPSTTSFTIIVSQIVDTFVAGGIAKGVGYQLMPIWGQDAERTSKRAAGRPFGSPVGRRRRRVKK